MTSVILPQRAEDILHFIKKKHFASVNQIQRETNIPRDTVRDSLKKLHKNKLILRIPFDRDDLKKINFVFNSKKSIYIFIDYLTPSSYDENDRNDLHNKFDKALTFDSENKVVTKEAAIIKALRYHFTSQNKLFENLEKNNIIPFQIRLDINKIKKGMSFAITEQQQKEIYKTAFDARKKIEKILSNSSSLAPREPSA